MLPDALSTELAWLDHLLGQPQNRWDGFAPEHEGEEGLRNQILFAGWAAAALAAHPEASPEQRETALTALGAAIERLLQRRVWADWATLTERAGLTPDPITFGGAALSGALSTLLGLSAQLGMPRYQDDPFTLHWSADYRFSYTHTQLNATLAAQLRDDPSGAIATHADSTSASAMALVLWGLHLGPGHDEAEQARARWIETLAKRMVMRGPRVAGRNALAASYNLRTRRAAFSSQPLEDGLALAFMAPFAPDLVASVAPRHWPSLAHSEAGATIQALGALLAHRLGETNRAEQLTLASANHPDGAQPIPHAVRILVACGGLYPPITTPT
ncbi:MAG: hypothetical protein AB4911_15005 [Oscillochloridaceae bacterium umkhey_bin13]